MIEKPMLFNTEMVKAILDNRKTSTRRIIKGVQGLDFIGYGILPKDIEDKATFGHGSFEDIVNAKIEKYIKPPYQVGDILYVRETWSEWTGGYAYKVGGDYPQSFINKWRPSIHMPRAAARIFLKVTDVKAQRVQDST